MERKKREFPRGIEDNNGFLVEPSSPIVTINVKSCYYSGILAFFSFIPTREWTRSFSIFCINDGMDSFFLESLLGAFSVGQLVIL